MGNEVKNYHEITRDLGHWYDLHHRTLPWRETNNPYFIWLSEIILQQTRVDQGMPYYLRFIDQFPTVGSLAGAKEDEVLKLWQGLGYYSRARNLHATSKYVANELNGLFPADRQELLKLKGVGKYTSAAIASIAFGQAVSAVDGNVIRVITRLFGITNDTNDTQVLLQIDDFADQLLNRDTPGRHNQAMMELGATVCTPKNPDCDSCPVRQFCTAKRLDLVDSIPFKSKKIKRRKRYFHYLVAKNELNKFYLDRRQSRDIWEGLYQFPLIETLGNQELKSEEIQAFFDSDAVYISKVNQAKKHVLSHQDILTRFYHIQLNDENDRSYHQVEESDVHNFALPRLIDRYLEEHDLQTGKTVLND